MVDYTEKLLSDLVEQFKGKPHIEALMEAIGEQLCDIAIFFEDLQVQRTLETAVGKQLDGIGDIVCLSREECAKYAGMFPRGCIGDEEYRALLKSKIIINTNDTTYYGIVRSIRSLYGAYPIYYSEAPAFPATIIFELDAAGGGNIAPLGFIPPVKAGGVAILWQYTIRAIIEVSFDAQSFPYSMPPCNTLYCGTFPCRATLGWTASALIECSIRLDILQYLTRFCGTYPYRATVGALIKAMVYAGAAVEFIQNDGKLCGTIPSGSTGGWSISGPVIVPGSSDSQLMIPPFSGDERCGTVPLSPVAARSIDAKVESKPSVEGFREVPPSCDDVNCGTYPDSPTLGVIAGGSADASASVILAKNTPARSSMTDCGTAPDKVMAGGATVAEVGASGETAGFAFDVLHESAECGTTPEAIGTAAETESATGISCSTEGYQVSAPFCNTKRCGQ